MKKRKRKALKCEAAGLNIMPFIDVFSMLNTFLLVSASFVSIGILKVQIPFFSNAPVDKSKPARVMDINITVEKEKMDMVTRWSLPPDDETKKEYKNDKEGWGTMHQDLIAMRQHSPDADKVTLFYDDDIRYDNVVSVIDTIKTLKDGDPTLSVKDEKTGEMKRSRYLYEKIVMGSVVL